MSIDIDKDKLAEALDTPLNWKAMPWICTGFRQGVFYDEAYGGFCLTIRNQLGNEGILQSVKKFGLGIFTCTGKISTPEAGEAFHFGAESHRGWYEDGFIYFDWFPSPTLYEFRTYNGTTYQSTSLPGEDWTNDTDFKFDWEATRVRAYIGGALKATHTTYIPNPAGKLMITIEGYMGGTPTNPYKEWLKYPEGFSYTEY